MRSIASEDQPVIAAPSSLLNRFMWTVTRWRIKLWFWKKEFTVDWTSQHLPIWSQVLSSWRTRPVRILEIGSWEGRSAVFFLKYMPRSSIICIDTFAGGIDALKYESLAKHLPHIENRFDRNTASFGARVKKIKDKSVSALEQLRLKGEEFDLIYIDGSHERSDVTSDTLGAWQLLRIGGIMIWDDYVWWELDKPAEEQPQAAIDEFLKEHCGQYQLLVKADQVIIRRVSLGFES